MSELDTLHSVAIRVEVVELLGMCKHITGRGSQEFFGVLYGTSFGCPNKLLEDSLVHTVYSHLTSFNMSPANTQVVCMWALCEIEQWG